MTDENLRRIERAVAAGDPEAGLRWLVAQHRIGAYKPRELHARPLGRSPREVSEDWAGIGGGGSERRCFECGAYLGWGVVPDWWNGAPCCPRPDPAVYGEDVAGCVDFPRAREEDLADATLWCLLSDLVDTGVSSRVRAARGAVEP